MSCQRCGGVLGSELAASMCELVCGKGVIENRYCHCVAQRRLWRSEFGLPRFVQIRLVGCSAERSKSG